MRKLWFCCLLLFTACGNPSHATAPSTPVIVNVALTPSVQQLAEVLHSCSIAHADFVLTINEMPASALDNQTADLVFRLGGSPGNMYAAAIGEESIVLIVNTDNPVLSIPLEKIHDLFTGQITSWVDVGGEQQSVQVWVYPEGDDVRSVFDAVIFPGENLNPQAILAPNPQAMLNAVADDPQAIGYVPRGWLVRANDVDRIRILNVDPTLAEDLRQPILALSRTEPEGLLRQLLGCVQSAGR